MHLRSLHKTVFLFIGISCVYLLYSYTINTFSTLLLPGFDYYSQLVTSILQGRLWIDPSQTHDLSLFQGKWYPYWGPGALIFIIPFYLLSLGTIPDSIYNLAAGLVNVFLFYLLVNQTVTVFKLNLSKFTRWYPVLHFALVSPNFYLSLASGVWGSSQLIAIVYLQLCMLCLLWFMQYKQMRYFFLATLFFNLTWFTRNFLLFYGLLFLYPLITLYRQKAAELAKKCIVVFLAITVFFIFIAGTYNYVRFASPLETGLRYQISAERYNTTLRSGKFFSAYYVPQNIYYYFFNTPALSPSFPFLHIDREGNSVIFVYPLLLTLLWYSKFTSTNPQLKLFLKIVSGICLMYVALLMFYFATGWMQFGNRFFLDIAVPVYLLSVFILNKVPTPVKVVLLLCGILLHLYGSLLFYTVS